MKRTFSTPIAARAAIMAVLMLVSFGLAAGVALASPTGVGSLAFDNGKPLSGFFSYDAASTSITNWDMTSDAFLPDALHHYQLGGAGASSFVSSNSNNDEVLSFFQNFSGEEFELDIVFACNGNANCINAGTLTTSFAIVGGRATCPPGLHCTSSQETLDAGFETHFLLSGFLNLSDPPEGGLSFNINSSIAPDHTLYGSSAPEPSTWAMMLLGFAGLGFIGYRRAREPRAA